MGLPDPPVKYSKFVMLGHDLFCLANMEGYLTWLSPRWDEVLGWSASELMSRPFVEFVHPADVDSTLAELERLKAGGDVVRFANRYRTRDGSWRWLEWNSVPLDDGAVVAVARDVTPTKVVERKLQQRIELTEMAEEIAQLGHWRVDLVHNSLYWSPEVYRIHGLTPETFTPTVPNAIDAYHPDDREQVSKHLENAVATKTGFEFELRILRQGTGEVRKVRAVGRVELSSDQEPIGIFGVFQDVTEQRTAQQRLAHTERLASLGTLAAGIGHEINNPLSYVLGNLELAADDLEDLASGDLESTPAELLRIRELLAEAETGAERIRDIVHAFRGFSRQVTPSPSQAVDVISACESSLAMAHSQIHHRATLQRRYEASPKVLGNETSLSQVVLNLVFNALTAMDGIETERVLSVGVRVASGDVFIEVSDTGCGMDEDTLTRVFEPFFTTASTTGGTGLGLSIVHNLVRELGGSVDIQSQPGRGSTFTIRIPELVDGAAPKPLSSRPGRQRPLLTGHVLIIDDDVLTARTLARMLERQFEVSMAHDGAEALRLLETNEYDVVVCDLMMPKMGGVEVYRQLDKRWPELLDRTLFITGGAYSPTESELAATLGERLLSKPIPAATLRGRVQDLLQRS